MENFLGFVFLDDRKRRYETLEIERRINLEKLKNHAVQNDGSKRGEKSGKDKMRSKVKI